MSILNHRKIAKKSRKTDMEIYGHFLLYTQTKVASSKEIASNGTLLCALCTRKYRVFVGFRMRYSGFVFISTAFIWVVVI